MRTFSHRGSSQTSSGQAHPSGSRCRTTTYKSKAEQNDPASIEKDPMELRKIPRMLSQSFGSDEFCRILLEDAPDAIIYADVGGMIRFWNHGAERIFGYTEAEVLGHSLDVIIPESLRKRHWDAYAETMRTGTTRYGAGDVLAVPAVRKDGTTVSIEFSILLFRSNRGDMLGAAAILRDVSKRFEETRALRSELATLRKQLEDRTR